MYLCQNCGAELATGLAKCRYCGAAAVAPQQPAGMPTAMPGGATLGGEQKSKLTAGLLAIFLGFLGIHNFYLGHNNRGIAQLLISVLSGGTLVIVSEIWAVIEGVQILTGSVRTDAHGIPLKE